MSHLRWRPFLYFTAATWAACLLLILFLDQPLARLVHAHGAGAVPFFERLTAVADDGYETSLQSWVLGMPFLFLALVLAYLVGRWGLRRRGATVFLVTLLTHLASVVTANVLKGVVHRQRPEVLFGPGYAGLGLGATAAPNDSFPSGHTAGYWSLLLPLALAAPPRWRPLLLALPVLMAVGRLVLGAHYVSDVLFSIWLVAAYTVVFSTIASPPWGKMLEVRRSAE